jgi:4'-phosphopantetheinyl transferase
MTSEARRRQFVTGRAGLRWLLAQQLGTAPASIDIAYSPTGKPILPQGNYHFNLSHAYELVVIALSSLPVGVDVEYGHRPCAIARIGARFFPEQDWTGADCRQKFWQLWTTKEAIGKAVGTGLFTPEPQVDYCLHHFHWQDYWGTVCQLGVGG